MNNTHKYIILGLTPQGLSLLRILGRAQADVTAFCTSPKNVGYRSRYGKKIVYDNISELKKGVSEIIHASEEKPICYITSGEILASVLREYKEIYDECHVFSGPYPVIEMLAHKDKMYEYAHKHNFRIAKYSTLDKEAYKNLSYPIFLKRNYEIPLFFKAVKIESSEELASFYNRIPKENLKDVIAQEFVKIGEKNLKYITCQGFWLEGKCCGIYAAYQKRRLKKGLTSYLEEITDSELNNKLYAYANSFMSELGYNGFAEFEYMYNQEDKALWFLEVNTRPCGTHSGMMYKFSNSSALILQPTKQTLLQNNTKPLYWMNIIRDIRARIENKDAKGIFDIFKSKFDIFDIKDPMPFFRQIL